MDDIPLSDVVVNPLELPAYEGFPYLWTQIVGALFHIIPLPNDMTLDALREIARRQATANKLRTCLVLTIDQCIYFGSDGHESPSDYIPRGGIILNEKLKPCTEFPHTEELAQRMEPLKALENAYRRRGGEILGDPPKVRQATPEDAVRLLGRQENGVPKGLNRCGGCGEWKGECLHTHPKYEGMIVRVHCKCENDNLCARCGYPLADRKLNASYYDELDGCIWQVQGFSGLNHECIKGQPPRE